MVRCGATHVEGSHSRSEDAGAIPAASTILLAARREVPEAAATSTRCLRFHVVHCIIYFTVIPDVPFHITRHTIHKRVDEEVRSSAEAQR